MGGWYPELVENRALISETIKAEEERFSQTLERGLKVFEEVAARGAISGEDAFTLAATYGFPVELTRELAVERGLAGRRGGVLAPDGRAPRDLAFGRGRAPSATSAGPPTHFVGYEKIDVLTAISAYKQLDERTFQAKLFESPFYAEGGGQVTDQGYIEHEETGARAVLQRRDRLGDDQVLTFEGEGFAEGDRVRAVVDWARPLPDDGEPHGDAPPAQGAPGRPRRPRSPGGLRGPAGQAPVRLHARPGALARRAQARWSASSTSRSSRTCPCTRS